MTSPTAARVRPPAHIESLDFLRGVAILMVVLYHFFGSVYGGDTLPWRGQWPDWRAAGWASFQWLFPLRLGKDGVMLFFVLSGFCIHYSILRHETEGHPQGPLAFYWKRWFRIVPAYWVAMAVAILLRGTGGWTNFLSHLTLTHTLFSERSIAFGMNPNFWSLAVEWQLYLIYPLLVVFRRHNTATSMLLICCFVAILFHYVVPLRTYPLTLARSPFYYWMDWVIGAYVADVWFHSRRPAFRSGWLLLAPLGVLWVMTVYYRPLVQQAWWIRPLFGAVLLDRTVAMGYGSGFLYRWISRIGVVSYSMYLLHLPVLWLIEPLCESLGLLRSPVWMMAIILPVYVVVVYAVAHLSYAWFELPSIRLGQHIWKVWKARRERGSVS